VGREPIDDGFRIDHELQPLEPASHQLTVEQGERLGRTRARSLEDDSASIRGEVRREITRRFGVELSLAARRIPDPEIGILGRLLNRHQRAVVRHALRFLLRGARDKLGRPAGD
jgi:hypothetical protein